ncbi:hypothetical protein HPP92_013101 [Vanilla planifolia]|uniref:Metallophosphoesterase n=1 Tax=Vanilla planifolia TaxID=51239 RepID=A0A835R1B0_VANPL|nr:hypothetical protein HPP92_013101 [Vanilla planifolia]
MAATNCTLIILLLCLSSTSVSSSGHRRSLFEVVGGPEGVVWVVQLSDLHFSVFHPERALDFRRLIGPALSMINPSLVLITGDLTDGKSKDLLTMKQEEAEWIEYLSATEEVILRSGLDKKVFYDLRGNHDKFGVPEVGGKYDFYQKYSINARQRRDGNVQKITLQDSAKKHIFIGVDAAMEIGLRGPTNIFGHPTDKLLADLDFELGESDTVATHSVTKISFGHFPMSFSAKTSTGKTLKDVFLRHSISAYLCGHLHSRFGKNLKRHHVMSTGPYFQFNMHQENPSDTNSESCSKNVEPTKEFWEWEMGDWRRSRSLRIVAIDSGHVSFLDLDYSSGPKDTIILPTFPLDARFMQRVSSPRDFLCLTTRTSYETIRALLFSRKPIVSVSAKIYDSRSGHFSLVLEADMMKLKGNGTRGDMYVAPWNWRAFSDPSPDRFWFHIVAVDIYGKSTHSPLRPFSINGLTADVSWNWTEFFVMGCQWTALYQPLLNIVLVLIFALLLIARAFLIFSKNCTTSNKISPVESRKKCIWVYPIDTGIFTLIELSRMTAIWWGILLYLIYLVFFPWFLGQVYSEVGKMSYISLRGWVVTSPKNASQKAYIGDPDIMVIVLPHLFFVVLPTVLVAAAMVAERTAYRIHFLSLSGKKQDDNCKEFKRNVGSQSSTDASKFWRGRWMRKFILFIILLILWRHWKQCRSLVKAYDMNPFLHAPVYCFWIPALLAFTVYKTTSAI